MKRQDLESQSLAVHFFKDYSKGDAIQVHNGTLFHWLLTTYCVTCHANGTKNGNSEVLAPQ
jgi:hypothetical protein